MQFLCFTNFFFFFFPRNRVQHKRYPAVPARTKYSISAQSIGEFGVFVVCEDNNNNNNDDNLFSQRISLLNLSLNAAETAKDNVVKPFLLELPENSSKYYFIDI